MPVRLLRLPVQLPRVEPLLVAVQVQVVQVVLMVMVRHLVF